ncbi:MAG: hypothetical protein Q7J69_01960, partial [Candidatus Omnitrophota bacterium]|nr:hypothetical protein [Candidatus Omnitrophota bacterium]
MLNLHHSAKRAADAGYRTTKLTHSRGGVATIRKGLSKIHTHEIRDAHGGSLDSLVRLNPNVIPDLFEIIRLVSLSASYGAMTAGATESVDGL